MKEREKEREDQPRYGTTAPEVTVMLTSDYIGFILK